MDLILLEDTADIQNVMVMVFTFLQNVRIDLYYGSCLVVLTLFR